MSSNVLVLKDYLIKAEILLSVLSSFIEKRNLTVSIDNKYLIESEALTMFEKILDFDFYRREIRVGECLDSSDFLYNFQQFELMLMVINTKLNALIRLFLEDFNYAEDQIKAIQDKINRCYQKKALYKLWNNEEANYRIVESFLNLDLLTDKFIESKMLSINSSQGCALLTEKQIKKLSISNVSIGKESNGFSGNSDIEVTTNNINLENILIDDPSYWFEYERMDDGPLTLELKIQLSKEEIVNRIKIVPVNVGYSNEYRIKDVTLSGSEGSVSIKDLVSKSLEEDTWSLQNSYEWELSFLPVKARMITFVFEQINSYLVETSNSKNIIERERFAIGLKRIEFYQVSYYDSGQISSITRNLPDGLSAVELKKIVFPENEKLYESKVEVSFDDGNKWSEISLDPVLLNNNSFVWRLFLKRNDELLNKESSFFKAKNLETKKISTVVSKLKSPYKISIEGNPTNGVKVFQSNLLSRGKNSKRTKLGSGFKNQKFSFAGFSLLEPEELMVFKNSKELIYNPDNEFITNEEWSISDDLESIILNGFNKDENIEILMKEERVLLESIEGKYYYKPKYNFDIDKNSIVLRCAGSEAKSVTFTLPNDKKVIKLTGSNIVKDSFQIKSENDIDYSIKPNRSLTGEDFYIDYINGFLWTKDKIVDDVVTVSYKYIESITLGEEEYSVVWDDIRNEYYIELTSIVSLEAEDQIGKDITPGIDLLTGEELIRPTDLEVNDKVKVLSYPNIIKGYLLLEDVIDSSNTPEEIDFYDGKQEFLGLVLISDERTTSIEADINGRVSFNLSASALFYREGKVSFSDTSVFGTEVLSFGDIDALGKYHISSNGLITVYVGIGNSLKSNILISYFYKNGNFIPNNKFSIDYKNGILYSGIDMLSNGKIRYKVANYLMSYDILRPLKQVNFDLKNKIVSVNTELMDSRSSNIKIFWEEQASQKSLEALSEYFSPTVQEIGFKFI